MSFDRVPIQERADGRWKDILSALGIDSKLLTGKHGPCFMCGGKDRFRWTNYKEAGGYFCSKCGSGTGTQLVMKYFQTDFRGAVVKIESVLGDAQPDRKKALSSEKSRELMREVWGMGIAIQDGDPVSLYLKNRGIVLSEYPKCLRYVPRLRHTEGSGPAMIAQVLTPEGRAANVHRTWLTEDGHKSSFSPCRKIMAGEIPSGSAIRLWPESSIMGIAEGIETALRASQRFKIPVWSVISEGGIQKFRPSEMVKELTIFGDNDFSFTGQAAAYIAAKDITTQSKKIERDILIRVSIPPKQGSDWADDQPVYVNENKFIAGGLFETAERNGNE